MGYGGADTAFPPPDWDVNVGLWVSLAVLTAALAAGGGAAYRLYYCKKKVRQYELQKEQQRLMAMGKLPGGGRRHRPKRFGAGGATVTPGGRSGNVPWDPHGGSGLRAV